MNNQTKFDLAVVIPVLNAAETIAEQLSALLAQDGDLPRYEVVIADNGSTDDTVATVERFAGGPVPVRVVDAAARRGVDFARNVGVRSTSAPWVALTDADDIVSSSWLAAYWRSAREGRAELFSGPVPPFVNQPGDTPNGPLETDLPVALGYLRFAHGCNVLFSRAAFDRCGGFSEAYPEPGSDDVEFSFALQEIGVTLSFVPEAVVHYRQRASANSNLRQALHYASSVALLYKRHRAHGARRRSLLGALRSWTTSILAVLASPALPPAHRRRALRRLAKNVGYLRGSLRYRVVYP